MSKSESDPGSGFSQNFDFGSERKMQNPPESTPALRIHGHLWFSIGCCFFRFSECFPYDLDCMCSYPLWIDNNFSILFWVLACGPLHWAIGSGVLKGRRARHLLRAPLFGDTRLRCYAHKFSIFLVKNLLSIHMMYYKADRK